MATTLQIQISMLSTKVVFRSGLTRWDESGARPRRFHRKKWHRRASLPPTRNFAFIAALAFAFAATLAFAFSAFAASPM